MMPARTSRDAMRRRSSVASRNVLTAHLRLELDFPLAAERASDAVVEAAKLTARKVVLVVARIEVVRNVKHLDADRRVSVREADPLDDLNVERDKLRIAPRAIA